MDDFGNIVDVQQDLLFISSKENCNNTKYQNQIVKDTIELRLSWSSLVMSCILSIL
jgi:hypothetical protein